MGVLASQSARRSLAFAQNHAQAYAEAAMNSVVRIIRPATASYDEATREYAVPATSFVYLGDAGITVAAGPITYSVGDEPTYFSSITCYVPHALLILPRIDDVIEVLTGPDADLNGRFFRITDVPVGGRVSTSMDLSATGIAPSRQWS